MKGAHFSRDFRDIVGELQGDADNFGKVLVIAQDKRGGAPRIWGTGSEQDSTQLLKSVAPEFSGLAEPADA